MLKSRILVVDDEEDLCEILRFNLESEGYIVDVAFSGEQALEMLRVEHSLVLLDVMMGGLSGFQTAEKIRKEKKMNIPIIFLTAKSAENDLLTGFSIGADDYIAKPFSIKEVLVRINSVLRRSTACDKKGEEDRNSPKLEFGDLHIDSISKEINVNGQKVLLTKKEFDLLFLLASNPNRVFSRAELLSRIWPESGSILDRTVDVHIARIRKKIGSYASKLQSRSGYGYCFEAEI